MGALIYVTVKKENPFTKVGVFTRSKIKVVIDEQNYLFKARKEPYAVEVTAGQHTIDFIDPKAKAKRRRKKVGLALAGGAMGFGAGGSGWGAAIGALDGASLVGKKTKDSTAQLIEIAENQVLKFSCKANRKGMVKVEVLP